MGLIYTILPEVLCLVMLFCMTAHNVTSQPVPGLHLLTLQATKRLALTPGVIVTKAVLK